MWGAPPRTLPFAVMGVAPPPARDLPHSIDSEAAADAFFAAAPPAPGLEAVRGSVGAFLAHHGYRPDLAGRGARPIALVTSGGTTAPLERSAVRFVDNFSSGSRGAASVEYLLARGYACIFLHREGSLRPFERSIPGVASTCGECVRSWGDNSLLGLFRATSDDVEPPSDASEPPGADGHLAARVEAVPSAAAKLAPLVRKHRAAAFEGALLSVPYVSVFEYLQLLRAVCCELGKSCETRAMVYLAAAVSDFYVPWASLPEHKIQSRDAGADGADGAGGVTVRLEQVPKMLGHVRRSWCPSAFVVGFKLETDPELLARKASASLRKYGAHAVVANEMARRKDRVAIASLENVTEELGVAPGTYDVLDRPAGEPDVERSLVDELVARHDRYARRTSARRRDEPRVT